MLAASACSVVSIGLPHPRLCLLCPQRRQAHPGPPSCGDVHPLTPAPPHPCSNHLCITFELLSINLYEHVKANNFQVGQAAPAARNVCVHCVC